MLKKILICALLICATTAASAFAQMEIEVGGKVEAQVGFRGSQSTAPLLLPSSVRPKFQKSTVVLSGIEKFERGLRSAIVTDSLIDIWATGTYDYECLGCTTYGAKIELFADPSTNKYSMDIWEMIFIPTSNITANINDLGFIPFFPSSLPDFPLLPFAVKNPGPAREVKIFLENCLGKFEIGDTVGATKHLQVDATTVAVGNGGIAGDARLWATPLTFLGMFGSADMITNKVAFFYLDNFFSPLLLHYNPNISPPPYLTFFGIGTEMRYAGKASYYTPRVAGLVAGISYIRDTDINGSTARYTSQIISDVSRKTPFGLGFKNVVEGGINYDCKIQDIGIKAAILGEYGKNKPEKITAAKYTADSTNALPTLIDTKNLRSYELGLGLDYCGFAAAGSYGVNKSLLEDLKDNKYWTVGVGYAYLDFGISVNYMDNRQKTEAIHDLRRINTGSEIVPGPGRFNEVKYRNLVVDVEYRICEGLIPYVSYGNLNVRQPYSMTLESKFNQGIGLLGLKVLF